MFLCADLPEARPIARLNATMPILGLLPGGGDCFFEGSRALRERSDSIARSRYANPGGQPGITGKLSLTCATLC